MYKIKESSGKNVIIKFSKQSEVNYQSVCIMNDLQPACLLPFEFVIKLFKVQMIYDAGELIRLSDIIKGQADNDTVIGLFADVLNSVGSFSSTGLDPKGLVYRADCMFVGANGRVKMAYAPAFNYDESNKLDNFVNDLLSAKADVPELCNMINQCYASFNGDAGTGRQQMFRNAPAGRYNEGETTVLGAKPAHPSVPDFSEGETTVLSANPMQSSAQPSVHSFSEGETTVLSAKPAQPSVPDFSEGETTVLSANPMQSSAQPSVHSFSEGETTVLSANPMQSSAQPSVHSFSEGETTVLSANDSPFAGNASETAQDDDFYNENATCLVVDSDFDINVDIVSGDDNKSDAAPEFDYNDHHMPHDEHDDYSETETTIPNIANPLSGDRTLIGSEGLAQAMAYSSIQANEKAADSYETVLLADDSTDKTAFFIRFINSQAVYVTKNYFTIGSGADMDYIISGNSLISKYHATVVIENSRFYIIDNKSTNKVFVDGREAVPYEKNEIFTGSRIVLANEIFDFYIK